MGFEVRSSDLEMGMSSRADVVRTEMDTTAAIPVSSQPSILQPPQSFHTLKDECSLNEETLVDLGIGSSFMRRLGFVFLGQVRNLVPLPMARCVSMRQPSCVVLDSLFIPL